MGMESGFSGGVGFTLVTGVYGEYPSGVGIRTAQRIMPPREKTTSAAAASVATAQIGSRRTGGRATGAAVAADQAAARSMTRAAAWRGAGTAFTCSTALRR